MTEIKEPSKLMKIAIWIKNLITPLTEAAAVAYLKRRGYKTITK